MEENNHNTLPQDAVSFRTWIAIFGAMLGAFMAVLDIQITNASLNDILGNLGATLDEGGWISTSYLVAEIVVIPLSGWLATIFGTRRYIVVNAALFLLASVACGMASSLGMMIGFRALQGLTGGVLIPMAFMLIIQMLPISKRPIGFTLFGITATFAPAIGPTIGGWLTENFGWQSIFYMNLIPGAVLIAAILYGVPRSESKTHLLRSGDWLGILTMAIGLASLTIFLEEGNKDDWFESPFITTLAITAAVSLTMFVIIELWHSRPLINLRLLTRRNFGFGSLVNVTLGMALYGSGFVLPLYLAQVQGYNAEQIGFVIMWMGLPQLFVLPFMPWFMRRFDARWLITFGLLLFGSSAFMNASMSHLTGYDQLRWTQLIRALGQPFIMAPLTNVTTGQIEAEQAGSASGLFNMMRNLGGSIGIGLLGTLITWREHLHSVRIGEAVTPYALATQDRLSDLTQMFMARGADTVTAGQQALTALSNTVRREAYVMAYNDAFYALGAAVFISAIAVWLTKRVQPGAGGAGAH